MTGWALRTPGPGRPQRSEEHTSELQSPCISYAVFCLKKKKGEFNCLLHPKKYCHEIPSLCYFKGLHFVVYVASRFGKALFFFLALPLPPRHTLFPYTTLFR